MRRRLPRLDAADLLVGLGAALIPAGIALMHVAAAVIVAGIELVLLGVALVRRPHGTSG